MSKLKIAGGHRPPLQSRRSNPGTEKIRILRLTTPLKHLTIRVSTTKTRKTLLRNTFPSRRFVHEEPNDGVQAHCGKLVPAGRAGYLRRCADFAAELPGPGSGKVSQGSQNYQDGRHSGGRDAAPEG